MYDPKVSIINFTGQGTPDPEWFAARLLVFTKNTRLTMNPAGFGAFMNAEKEDIEKELEYMSNTIPSSWEFVDVVFSIQQVTRACAQQITRTRNASYAMQSQRVTNMADVSWHVPDSVKNAAQYDQQMRDAVFSYKVAVDSGESLEDARGLLPLNVHCNLIAKYNLRSLVELLRARDSMRVQGEYQMIAHQMRELVKEIWPWSAPFFKPKDEKAIALIEEVAHELTNKEQRMQLAKAADMLKK